MFFVIETRNAIADGQASIFTWSFAEERDAIAKAHARFGEAIPSKLYSFVSEQVINERGVVIEPSRTYECAGAAEAATE